MLRKYLKRILFLNNEVRECLGRDDIAKLKFFTKLVMDDTLFLLFSTCIVRAEHSPGFYKICNCDCHERTSRGNAIMRLTRAGGN